MMPVQVVGYVEDDLKELMEGLRDTDRRYTFSRQIEEALRDWLPRVKQTLPAQPRPIKKEEPS